MSQAEDPAVTRFREYLRINTVQPKPDYRGFYSEFGHFAWLKVKESNLLNFQPPPSRFYPNKVVSSSVMWKLSRWFSVGCQNIDKINFQPIADRPFVILTRTGTDPSLKSVVFYSHIDVVPVFEVSRQSINQSIGTQSIKINHSLSINRCQSIEIIQSIRRITGRTRRSALTRTTKAIFMLEARKTWNVWDHSQFERYRFDFCKVEIRYHNVL